MEYFVPLLGATKLPRNSSGPILLDSYGLPDNMQIIDKRSTGEFTRLVVYKLTSIEELVHFVVVKF